MNEYIIYYEHPDYGYYTETLHAKTLLKAIKDFNKDYEHDGIYGASLKFKSHNEDEF